MNISDESIVVIDGSEESPAQKPNNGDTVEVTPHSKEAEI